jgi:hypothetical protein
MKTKLLKKDRRAEPAPLENKMFFIGISLGENNTAETSAVVLNRNLDLLKVEKLFTNYDIEVFLKNFPGTYDSVICMSLPLNAIEIESKWRREEKDIHAFKLYNSSEDMFWADRFSERGKEIFETLKITGHSIYRYHIPLSKIRLNLMPPFKMRSQPGCKYLQTVIKDRLSVNNLPSNLIPIAALDAVIGGYTGWLMATDKQGSGYEYIDDYLDQKVVLPLKINPRPVDDQEVKKKKKK